MQGEDAFNIWVGQNHRNIKQLRLEGILRGHWAQALLQQGHLPMTELWCLLPPAADEQGSWQTALTVSFYKATS